MSTSDDCDYCYGTMGLCPVCGPFEYARSVSVGYDHKRGLCAETISGWDISGMMPDWEDRANARGWSTRDTKKWLDTWLGRDDLVHKASTVASPLLSRIKAGA